MGNEGILTISMSLMCCIISSLGVWAEHRATYLEASSSMDPTSAATDGFSIPGAGCETSAPD